MEAIKHDSPAMVRDALAAGASIEDTNHDGKKALEYAQVRQSPEAARELIKHGADVNMTVGKRNTPLIKKCLKVGDYGFMSLLLEHGANADGLTAEGYAGDLLRERRSNWSRSR